MQDKFQMNELLDFYGGLFTKKQQTIFHYYYALDLTMQEIADLEQISKSAVHDMINRGKKELLHYEDVLGFLFASKKRQKQYKALLKMPDENIQRIVNKCIKTEGGKHE